MLTNVYYVDDLSKKEKYKQEGKKLRSITKQGQKKYFLKSDDFFDSLLL